MQMDNWPLSALRVTTPRLVLRWPTMEDLDALADRGAEGVHDPDFMPFFSHWTDGDRDTVARRVLQRHWTALGAWSSEDWTLYLAVVHDGVVIGSQSIGARSFVLTREVLVTAWLGRRFQGQGFGTEARAALLELAFTGLDADYAVSVIQQGNDTSQGVRRKLGFVPDGVQVNVVRGQQTLSDRYRLDRASWQRHRIVPAKIRGLAPGLQLFGLPAPADKYPSADGPVQAASTATATRAARQGDLATVLSGIRYDDEGDHPVD